MRPEEVELVRRDYAANGGWETFLAYEDPRQDILVGLLRLRKVSGSAAEAPAAGAARQGPPGTRAETAGQRLGIGYRVEPWELGLSLCPRVAGWSLAGAGSCDGPQGRALSL